MYYKVFKKTLIFIFVAASLLMPFQLAAQESVGQKSDIVMDESARVYLEEVFTFIRENAVFRNRLKWDNLRGEAFALAKGAKTTADTYPAVEFLISKLGDNHHSAFFPAPTKTSEITSEDNSKIKAIPRKRGGVGAFAFYPSGIIFEVLPNSPAQRAGLRVGDKISTVNGRSTSDYERNAFALSFFGEIAEPDKSGVSGTEVSITYERFGEKKARKTVVPFGSYSTERIPNGRRLKFGVGYVEVPMSLGQTTEVMTRYAETMQNVIKQIDTGKPGDPPVRYWIIDLRRNQGGNSWGMLAGLGPLLGEGVIGVSSDSSNHKQDETSYENGQAKLNGEVIAAVAAPYKLRAAGKISIAVITGPMTASSGEFAALWFKGLDNTKSFGEPTYGVPTVNTGHMFSDGSGMNLTVGLGTDRTGQIFSGPISPDKIVASDWTLFQTEKDLPVASAAKWLRSKK